MEMRSDGWDEKSAEAAADLVVGVCVLTRQGAAVLEVLIFAVCGAGGSGARFGDVRTGRASRCLGRKLPGPSTRSTV